jgi:DNA polymerase elongation subunit (family B)
MAERVEFLLLDIDYVLENGETAIRLWGKAKNGGNVLVLDRAFKPYFYLEPDAAETFDLRLFREKLSLLEEIGKKVKKAEMVEKNLLGEARKFVKIVLKEPGDISTLRGMVEKWKEIKRSYEYDVPFYRRYLIDKGLTPMGWAAAEGEEKSGFEGVEVIEAKEIAPAEKHAESGHAKLVTLALDIEVYGDEIIMVSLAGENFRKVLTYGWKNETRMRHVEILGSEKEMLARLAEILKETGADIIVTYNGDLFDMAKLRERAHFHKVAFNLGRDGSGIEFVKRARDFSAWIAGRTHVDLYTFMERILADSMESETLTLDMVSKELLGFGKEPLDWKKIEEIWKERKDLKTIANYCLRDSELTIKLAERLLPQIFELSRLVGQTPFDTSRMTYSQLVEWLLIRHAYNKDEIALNRPTHDEIKRRREAAPYAGGYVLPPEPGIHEAIALFDFASLYPSTIITHNISPETLDKDGEGKAKNTVPESEHYFSTGKKGFIPEIIEGLVRKRTEIKEQMASADPASARYKDLYNRQYALKILANASYGYYAYAGSRWYSRICAMSIAAFGRYYIQKVINFAKERRLNVIYGDTDSLFIAGCSETKARKFMDDVNATLPGVMELDLEGIYKSGIFVPAKTGATAKKRYALLDRNERIMIRGLEKVRRDWCNIAKDTQEKVLLAILKERDEKKAVAIVRDVIDRINKGDIDAKDLVIYTQITKPLDQYEQIGPHVAAARKYIEHGQTVKEGSVIGYIVTRGDGSISSRAEPFEYAENYDPAYYINNQILPAAMRILYGLGFSEEDVLQETGESQQSLNAFMKKSLRKKLKSRFEKFKAD